jgi:uncharacterized protein
MIEIKLTKDYNLSGYTLIEGFPGLGLVGPMTNSYMIEKLKMEYIGYIDGDIFPPIATIHDGKPMFPIRLYKDDKYRIIVVIAEFAVPSTSISFLAEELLGFIRKNKIGQIISVGGIPVQKISKNIYGTASNDASIKKLKDAGITPINEGVVAGVSALLLTRCTSYKIPAISVLVPVIATVMDPKYAEMAILGLNKLINMDIDTEELEEESKEVQEKVKELLKNAKETHQEYKNALDMASGEGPSTYA